MREKRPAHDALSAVGLAIPLSMGRVAYFFCTTILKGMRYSPLNIWLFPPACLARHATSSMVASISHVSISIRVTVTRLRSGQSSFKGSHASGRNAPPAPVRSSHSVKLSQPHSKVITVVSRWIKMTEAGFYKGTRKSRKRNRESLASLINSPLPSSPHHSFSGQTGPSPSLLRRRCRVPQSCPRR